MGGGWTALIPLKPAAERKTRLAPRLSGAARIALSEAMFDHVAAVLRGSPLVERVVLLAATPGGWDGDWLADEGRGLNAELRAAQCRLNAPRLIVIHADLPLLAEADIAALVAAAAGGCAIAPDRHGTGSNALALHGLPDFAFAFGTGSCGAHQAAAGGGAGIVRRQGLAIDVDTPADLDISAGLGFVG